MVAPINIKALTDSPINDRLDNRDNPTFPALPSTVTVPCTVLFETITVAVSAVTLICRSSKGVDARASRTNAVIWLVSAQVSIPDGSRNGRVAVMTFSAQSESDDDPSGPDGPIGRLISENSSVLPTLVDAYEFA